MSAGLVIAVVLVVLAGLAGAVAIVASVGGRKARPFLCAPCEGLDAAAPCECLYGCGATSCQAYPAGKGGAVSGVLLVIGVAAALTLMVAAVVVVVLAAARWRGGR